MMATKIQLRRDTTQNWSNINPVLSQGEIGIDLNKNDLKIGNGTSNWNSLNYVVDRSSLVNAINSKQDILVSGTNIKTINGQSLLGSGNITISGSVDPKLLLHFGKLPVPFTTHVVPYAVNGTSPGTLAFTANRVYFLPFVVLSNLNITDFIINVTTASTGNCWIGLYASNKDMMPTVLLHSSSAIATGTTGLKTYTPLSPVSLIPDLYYLAIVSSATATVRAIATGGLASLNLASLGTNMTVGFYYSSATLPSNATGLSLLAYFGSVPAVAVNYSVV